MNKDIKKYQRKERLHLAIGVFIPTISVLLGFVGASLTHGLISVFICLSAGVVAALAIVKNKHVLFRNTARQLEFREQLKDFTDEEKEIVKKYIKNQDKIDYKNNTVTNVKVTDNIEILKDNISLIKKINYDPKIVKLLDSIYKSKFDSITNLTEALTISDNVPADAIYLTEKLKLKSKFRKINNK